MTPQAVAVQGDRLAARSRWGIPFLVGNQEGLLTEAVGWWKRKRRGVLPASCAADHMGHGWMMEVEVLKNIYI
jgi:hypothetical protein